LEDVVTLRPPTVISSVASLSVADKLAESRNLLDRHQEKQVPRLRLVIRKTDGDTSARNDSAYIRAAALTPERLLVVFSSSFRYL